MTYLRLHNDKSITDINNKILFLSIKKFITEIVDGNNCFLCGAESNSKEFNDEHIIPDWILRRFGLHNKNIILPNNNIINYSKYKVPCCKECNTLLSDELEKPISDIFSKGFNELSNYIKKNGISKVFIWLCLIFLKVHLKDRYYRLFMDKRVEEYKISELYNWEGMHHLHCVSRTVLTKCLIDPKVFGSLILFKANPEDIEQFDYGDFYQGYSIMLRLGDICIIAVLNDSCASLNLFDDNLKKIDGFLNQLQYREILAHLSFINLNLKYRPVYYTEVNKDEILIKAEIPEEIVFEETNEIKFNDLLYNNCHQILERIDHPDKEYIIENIKQGRWSFLFDENGEFIKN